MRSSVQSLCVVLIFSILSASLSAQEKTQYYYSTHESEILPDANASFQRGDYERTIELCKWHYIIVGTQSADNLRNKAERCASLKKEMESLRAAGKTMEARDIAKTILSINPSDALAKGVSQLPDPVKPETPSLSKLIPKLIPENQVDTVVVVTPEESLELPPKEKEIVAYNFKKETPIREIVKQDPIPETEKWPYSSKGIAVMHNCFVVKAGVSLYKHREESKPVYPSVSMGLYDIRGSRSGIEMGLDIWSGQRLVFYSASYVFRASRFFYPKTEIGIITYSGNYEEPFIGLGSSYFLGKFFCFEIRTIYRPADESFTPSFKVGVAF